MKEDAVGTEKQIELLCYGQLTHWYSRKESGSYPPPYLNIDTTISPGASVESNLFVKVASQPDLWNYVGEIPCLIRAVSGLTLLIRNLTQEKAGSFHGTVAYKYEVKIDDRLIDSEGKEYKVESVQVSQSFTFRSMSLSLLP